MFFLLNEPWLLFVTSVIALFVASAAGYAISAATRINEDKDRHDHIVAMREGLFVLLGLLLGFTVSMALSRFDHRRGLVVEESNVIGTTILRAELLPEPQRAKSLDLLREYVLVRRGFSTLQLRDESAMNQLARQTAALQERLWQQVVAVTQQSQTSVVTSYIQTLNETIDVSEKRLAAFESRIPESVWMIIAIVAVFQSFVNGYSLKRKFWFSLVTTPLVVGIVMALMADLDSPRTGLVRVQQDSMERLAREVTSSRP